MFEYSPKKGAILESVQSIYDKKPLTMLKAAVTRWLIHGRASTPTKSYCAAYQEYIDILKDLGETRKSLRFQGSQINIQNFH